MSITKTTINPETTITTDKEEQTMTTKTTTDPTANNNKEESTMFTINPDFNPHTMYLGIGFDAEYVGDSEPDFIKTRDFSFEPDEALNNGGFYKSPLYETNSEEDNERYRLFGPFLCWLYDRQIVTDSKLCCLQIAINANYFGDYDEQKQALNNLRKFADKFWNEIKEINLAPHELTAKESPWDEYEKQIFAKKVGDMVVFKWHGTQDYLKLWSIIELTKLVVRLTHAKFDLSSFEDLKEMCEVFTDTNNQFYKYMIGDNLYR